MINSQDWVFPESRNYEAGKALLTQEANAAIRAFFDNGFDQILVLDGHGMGGLNLLDLDERVLYQRGFVGPYPLGFTEDYDAIAWVGQHAKASTPFAHIAHTSSIDVLDQRINQISVGEFGMHVFLAAALGIRPIYGSGDLAFCKEAKALCPRIFTTRVKEGLTPGEGRECLAEEYRQRNTAAIHLHPKEARRRIYEDAGSAARAFFNDPDAFSIQPLSGPFHVAIDYRADIPNVVSRKTYDSDISLADALNKSWEDQ